MDGTGGFHDPNVYTRWSVPEWISNFIGRVYFLSSTGSSSPTPTTTLSLLGRVEIDQVTLNKLGDSKTFGLRDQSELICRTIYVSSYILY